MKRYFFICLLALLAFATGIASAEPRKVSETAVIAEGSDVKVFYSFDHYANNKKVTRTFISGDMLAAAQGTKLFKSTAWDISTVVSRLTSLLSLHTHSVSTTQLFQKDLSAVRAKKAYECLMQSQWDDIKLYVFAHRSRGKGNLDELLIFKFRNTYCTRVIQMTGKLRTADIATIIKMAK